MSLETMMRFIELVRTNDEVQAQLDGVDDPREFVERAVRVAAEHGISFPAGELWSGLQQAGIATGELDDAQLEAVAGGVTNQKSEKQRPIEWFLAQYATSTDLGNVLDNLKG
jgi:predicted ribosomally synthesized peptide with nif11-like leader